MLFFVYFSFVFFVYFTLILCTLIFFPLLYFPFLCLLLFLVAGWVHRLQSSKFNGEVKIEGGWRKSCTTYNNFVVFFSPNDRCCMVYNNFSLFDPIELLLVEIVVFFATIAGITRNCHHIVAQNTTLFGANVLFDRLHKIIRFSTFLQRFIHSFSSKLQIE